MRRVVVLIAILLVLLAGVAAFLLLRPPVEAISLVDPDVTIECAAATSVSADGCLDWGDQIIESGAPSTTFEMEDLGRLRLTRELLGIGSVCQVEYFLQRYPDDAVWADEVECLGPDR